MALGKSSRHTTRLASAVVIALVLALTPAGAAWAGPSFVGSAVRPAADGYWLVSDDGIVSANGNARHLGDMGRTRLNRPIVGMAATPSGEGYWLVAGDGGIFSFGDARFFGSTGGMKLNKPVVGMASTPSANGYWMVASDGGIFAFGDAPFYGSTGSMSLNQPIVGMSPTHNGGGYWMVASDGGIFAFGSAGFFGSTGSLKLNQPVVSMSTSPTGRGYWLAASDGGIFAFGDAPFLGAGVDGTASRTIALVRDVFGGYTIVKSNGHAAHRSVPVASPRPSLPDAVPPLVTVPVPTTTAPRPTTTVPRPTTTVPPVTVPPVTVPPVTTPPVTVPPVTVTVPPVTVPSAPTSFRVSFQPEGAPVPSGYSADHGGAFDGLRGWFNSSGVATSLVGNTRDRNVLSDQRFDSFIHMQLPASTTGTHVVGKWEHRVANGTYDVTVGAGDPSHADSRHVINVEGTRTIDFTPSGVNTHWSKVRVTVNDGRLTIDANGGSNTKLGFVELAPASGGAPSVQLAPATPVPATPAPSDPNSPWQLTFEDNFDKKANEGDFLGTYGDKWWAYPWGWLDTSKRGNYDPNIISVDNGTMNMRLHTTADGKHRVAAPVPRPPGGSNQLYGRYEARMRADAVAGYKAAWLLWPQSEVWPRDGEIDFPEGDLTGTFYGFMYRQGATHSADGDKYQTSARFTDWHTVVIEWMPNRLNFILDGQVIGSSTRAVPNTPMRWVLQNETVITGAVPNNTSGNVQVDYVKIWKYTG